QKLSTVLQERNQLKEQVRCQGSVENVRKMIMQEFKKVFKNGNLFRIMRTGDIGTMFTRVINSSTISVRVLYGDAWVPLRAKTLAPSRTAYFPGFAGAKYLFFAPFLSEDPLDGSDFV
ncbi:hypothetical protein PFISCL1PPCAC_23017, partial [Pristionchus fissidentatus]